MGHKLGILFGLLFCIAPAAGAMTDDRSRQDRAIEHALLALGVEYRYGGSSPETGFDCSGLVSHVFHAAWGLPLPRQSSELSRVGAPVRLRDLRAGDLVFYNTRNRPFSHVGIYVGDGRFVHAPKPGARVRLESAFSPYWKARFNGARRLQPPA